jgi:4-hydroxy-2-oxoheptanedioate aldolase
MVEPYAISAKGSAVATAVEMLSLRTKLARGDKTIGGWCTLPSPFSADVMTLVGFDWICADWQHGLADFETIALTVRTIGQSGVAPLVRVPYNEPWLIGKALDAGACGVIVPLVNTPDEARRAARACRYPPDGGRSFGQISAPLDFRAPADCNREVLCFVMIETSDGLANVDEICAIEGIDGVYVGPADLGLSLEGVPGDYETGDSPLPERILEACHRHGRWAGIHSSGGEAAKRYLERGFSFCAIASDLQFLATGAAAAMVAARGSAGPQHDPPYPHFPQLVVDYP